MVVVVVDECDQDMLSACTRSSKNILKNKNVAKWKSIHM